MGCQLSFSETLGVWKASGGAERSEICALAWVLCWEFLQAFLGCCSCELPQEPWTGQARPGEFGHFFTEPPCGAPVHVSVVKALISPAAKTPI